MNFYAKLRPYSTIDRMWRNHNRLGGLINNVLFQHTRKNDPYETVPLSADQVEIVKNHPDVELIMLSAPLTSQDSLEQAVAPPAPDSSKPIAPGAGTEAEVQPPPKPKPVTQVKKK